MAVLSSFIYKADWCKKGEKCNQFFLNLELQRQSNNVIKFLKCKDGHSVQTENEILKEIASYYENLFSLKSIRSKNIEQYLSSVKVTKHLADKDKCFCDKTIIQEIETTIMNLKTSKSSGLDGLTPEFYKHFWPTLKQPFFNMINDTFLPGYLPDSFKTAVVTLLRKDIKDDLKNYRPISLTNYDYKIIAFVLTARLQKVIDGIISTRGECP